MCRSVVVSAALLRIFGREVAELPLVATSKEYQGKVSIWSWLRLFSWKLCFFLLLLKSLFCRNWVSDWVISILVTFIIIFFWLLFQGYFLALFSRIEKLLCALEVKNLVLPAAEKAKYMWVNRLGFRDVSQERVSKHPYILLCWLNAILLWKQSNCFFLNWKYIGACMRPLCSKTSYAVFSFPVYSWFLYDSIWVKNNR